MVTSLFLSLRAHTKCLFQSSAFWWLAFQKSVAVCEQGGRPGLSFHIPFFCPFRINHMVSVDVKGHEKRRRLALHDRHTDAFLPVIVRTNFPLQNPAYFFRLSLSLTTFFALSNNSSRSLLFKELMGDIWLSPHNDRQQLLDQNVEVFPSRQPRGHKKQSLNPSAENPNLSKIPCDN